MNSDPKDFNPSFDIPDHCLKAKVCEGSGTMPGNDFKSESALSWGVAADEISRRRFLSLLSASAALALGVTSCSRIDRGKIVPYTKLPARSISGVATYYASTFHEGFAVHGVLVKTREGRPIHVEGNAEYPGYGGKASLRAVADVLGLYDPDRLGYPSLDGARVGWDKADQEIVPILRQARDAGKPLLLFTDAVLSPTCNALIAELKQALPTLRHAAWEPAASQPEIQAARVLYGEYLSPRLRLDRAEVILSLQADFLGAEGNPSASIRDFAARRLPSQPTDAMNRLWVMEGCMTLTGANADQRLQIKPSNIAPLIFALARFLNDQYRIPFPREFRAEGLQRFDLDTEARDAGIEPDVLRALAADLQRAGNLSLVIAGSALAPEAHMAGQLLNAMLGAEGHTVDVSSAPSFPEVLTCAELRDLLKEAAQGAFAAAIFWGANPAYSSPYPALWKTAIANIPARIRIGLYEDETALGCRWRLPEHHWLESWGDFEPATDLLSLRQPTVGAIHNSRQGEDILLTWLNALGADNPATYVEYIKDRWQKEVYPSGSPADFQSFWNAALHDGVLRRAAKPRPPRVMRVAALADALLAAGASKDSREEFELVLQPDHAVYDGRYANNGWLNELPNPVTKTAWGNPLLLSIADAERLGIKDGDLAKVSAGSETVEVPVTVQPGQMTGVASLALGYGRSAGNVASGIGINAFPLLDTGSMAPFLHRGAIISTGGKRRPIPTTQRHSRMEGRDLARTWTLEAYARQISGEGLIKGKPEFASLIPEQKFAGTKWGMVIDLSACTGCSACVIGCQSENNIPVVGPERVEKGREMHWIRVDRYYEGDLKDPSVSHQPIPCQHCDNAPCEIVCPVNATNHSPDGLNQMAYNRCVGTRYCSNNCPFKVRRFNFFDYTSMKKDPERLVFNPEVSVRPRGVMEKCSFCIQRIEDVKLGAKAEGRDIRDGEVQPACAAACPADAIAFGDLNHPQGRVAILSQMNRGYKMLTELGIKPSVTYLADISNPVTGKGKA